LLNYLILPIIINNECLQLALAGEKKTVSHNEKEIILTKCIVTEGHSVIFCFEKHGQQKAYSVYIQIIAHTKLTGEALKGQHNC
jgi:hypothetical protein